MSMKYTAIEDQLIMLIDALQSEPDILIRLKNIKTIEKKAQAMIRTLKRETAYKARDMYTSQNIADVIGSDRKDVDYWVRSYYEEKGIERPRYVRSADIADYIDLSVMESSSPD